MSKIAVGLPRSKSEPVHGKRGLMVFRFVVLQMRIPIFGSKHVLLPEAATRPQRDVCEKQSKGFGETARMRRLA